jgi:hypothetical protein
MQFGLVVVGACFLLGACTLFPTGCDADLLIQMSPADTSIRVGDQFHVGVTLRGCHGQRPLSDVVLWTSDDSSVARVGAATGTVSGVRPGDTVIRGTGVTYGNVAASRVSVRP